MSKIVVYSKNTLTKVALLHVFKDAGWTVGSISTPTAANSIAFKANRPDLLVGVVSSLKSTQKDIVALGKQLPATPLVLIHEDCDASFVLSKLPTQVRALLSVEDEESKILAAVSLVLEGHTVMPVDRRSPEKGDPISLDQTFKMLTRREEQILTEVARGFSNKEIGRRLRISSNTVDVHVSSIIRKLGVKNRAHAVAAMRVE